MVNSNPTSESSNQWRPFVDCIPRRHFFRNHGGQGGQRGQGGQGDQGGQGGQGGSNGSQSTGGSERKHLPMCRRRSSSN